MDHDLMAVLRAGAYDRAIEDALLDATWVEPAGHAIAAPPFVQPD